MVETGQAAGFAYPPLPGRQAYLSPPDPRLPRRPAYFARIAAATTGSGSGHGTAPIDIIHPILRPQKGKGDRTGTLARGAAKITDHAQRVAN